MASKRRTDAATVLEQARGLASEVATAPVETRAARLAAGLRQLWPAPLHAALLGANDTAAVVLDEAGRSRPDWAEALGPELRRRRDGDEAALPAALGLADHGLHAAAIERGGRCYGVVALGLHRRTADVAAARTLLGYVADHVAFALEERAAAGRLRDLADFAALVAHDFSNSLNSIGLQVAVLTHKGISPEQYPELDEVRREVRRAGARLRQLQELCSQQTPSSGKGDVNVAVRATAPAGTRLDLASDLPAVGGDALDLERLLGVLLAGATAAGARTVTVRTLSMNGSVHIRIEDDGTAPDPELLPQLFEPFVQARPGADPRGLALAKAVARRVDGSVNAEPRPGGGMTFVVALRPARE